jgi:hypothetical protein
LIAAREAATDAVRTSDVDRLAVTAASAAAAVVVAGLEAVEALEVEVELAAAAGSAVEEVAV